MAGQKKISKTKQQVTHVINQARESLRRLGTLERETFAKARTLIRIPNAAERRRLTNDKILSSLRKLGVATQAEVEELHLKVQKLETVLHKNREKHLSHRSKSTAAGD